MYIELLTGIIIGFALGLTLGFDLGKRIMVKIIKDMLDIRENTE